MPGLPVPHHLPEFAQAHIRWVSDAVQTLLWRVNLLEMRGYESQRILLPLKVKLELEYCQEEWQ